MWSYVVFSYWVFPFKTVAIYGLVCSILHTFSPVIYKYSKSLTLTGLNISITGLIFQFVYCLFNDGIYSPAAIWFTAHPVIISFFSSKRLIYFSVILNIFVVLLLTYLGNNALLPADVLDQGFTQAMTISSLIGLDIIIATYTIVFINSTKNSYKELEERNELIEGLIRIISHDINNSLTISDISLNWLDTFNLEPVAIRKLNLIKRSNKEILEICTMVREWIKSNDTKLELELKDIPLKSIVSHIDSSFADQLKNKNIYLKLNNDVNDEQLVRAEFNSLCYQVINNIFTNAIKFSNKDGNIYVDIKENKKHVDITIMDNGIGIPEDILVNLFNPSKNWSRKGTHDERGTGFGMPIVKNLIDAMGCELSVKSRILSRNCHESGTTVIVSIPKV
jgi:signal transduction histidine kinase